jgi:uncharacterized protein (TIGR03790 family)
MHAPLMGNYTWGSNDPNFNKVLYKTLRFAPGAIDATVVSTCGRTFTNPNAVGQSLAGDLVHEGASGTKCYVSEPFSDAMPHADILFDMYTHGYNLAEGFNGSSPYICWKDMVIGDPLSAVYALHGN